MAVACAQGYLGAGYRWVVDADLEKFFDRVNYYKLMARVKQRISDAQVLNLIDRYLPISRATLTVSVSGGCFATVWTSMARPTRFAASAIAACLH